MPGSHAARRVAGVLRGWPHFPCCILFPSRIPPSGHCHQVGGMAIPKKPAYCSVSCVLSAAKCRPSASAMAKHIYTARPSQRIKHLCAAAQHHPEPWHGTHYGTALPASFLPTPGPTPSLKHGTLTPAGAPATPRELLLRVAAARRAADACRAAAAGSTAGALGREGAALLAKVAAFPAPAGLEEALRRQPPSAVVAAALAASAARGPQGLSGYLATEPSIKVGRGGGLGMTNSPAAAQKKPVANGGGSADTLRPPGNRSASFLAVICDSGPSRPSSWLAGWQPSASPKLVWCRGSGAAGVGQEAG
jgi:hypothetical protein